MKKMKDKMSMMMLVMTVEMMNIKFAKDREL